VIPPEVLTLPPPLGVAQVPSPRQNVEDEALVPPPRLATGRLPDTSPDPSSSVATPPAVTARPPDNAPKPGKHAPSIDEPLPTPVKKPP